MQALILGILAVVHIAIATLYAAVGPELAPGPTCFMFEQWFVFFVLLGLYVFAAFYSMWLLYSYRVADNYCIMQELVGCLIGWGLLTAAYFIALIVVLHGPISASKRADFELAMHSVLVLMFGGTLVVSIVVPFIGKPMVELFSAMCIRKTKVLPVDGEMTDPEQSSSPTLHAVRSRIQLRQLIEGVSEEHMSLHRTSSDLSRIGNDHRFIDSSGSLGKMSAS